MGPGWIAGRRGGRAARPVPAGRPDPGADGRRGRQRPGLAGAAAVLHAPPARAGTRGAADGRPRGAGTGAHRPGGPGSGRADHARLLAAGPGGPAAGLPAVLRRGRGVGAPGAGRGVGRAGRRPDQPLPLLPGRLAAGREGVLLRPQAPAGPGPGGRAAVSPPGVPAHGRHHHRGGRCDLRCRPGQDELLRSLGQPGRPLAGDLGRAGHRAPQRRVARRPDRLRAGRAAAGGGPGGGGRPDRAAPGPGRPAVRLHRCGRAARQARGGGSGRPGPVPLARPDRPGSGRDPERLRHPGRRRAQPGGAGRLLDQARDQRDYRA